MLILKIAEIAKYKLSRRSDFEMCKEYRMNEVKFKNDEDVLEKLKEMNIIAKTKPLSALSQVVYKSIDENGQVISRQCEIIGYNWKETNKSCINKIYENLTVKVDDKIFNINADYLKDMQKKSWGTIKESDVV